MAERETNHNPETPCQPSIPPADVACPEALAAAVPDSMPCGENPETPSQPYIPPQPADVACPEPLAGAVSDSMPCGDVLDYPLGVCRLVMLGKTGNGKSSTGNSIIGFKRYCSRSAFESVTFDCSWQSVRRFGVEVEVVDTPGFFDTEMAENKLKKEIVKCVGMASPGPHALLVTVRIDVRFTDEEADTIRKIRFAFGDHIMRHIIIIFTHGDALDDDESMEDRLRGSPAGLSNLLEETGARYVVFNNTKALPQDKKDEQVKKLLLKVGELLAATSNQHFSNPFLIRCHDNVMACAKQIAQILDGSSASETAQALLRACLESTDSAEELLHDLRDSNNVTSSQLKQLTDKLNAWEKGKADSDKQIRSLTKALRYAQKLMENLKQELEEEKKSWKMCILM